MYPEPILPIVAHIPHAGTHIPAATRSHFTVSDTELWRELIALTDWYSHELFGLPGVARSSTPISRLGVDLERYCDDTLEKNARFGQGVIYTHDSCGRRIRCNVSEDVRRQLLAEYYTPWHLHLELCIEQQLARWGHCLLLDCHSFPDQPFAHEDDRGQLRPDICLGTGPNTPRWLLARCYRYFEALGLAVAVDFPYAGCLVPERFAGNPEVPAIMLEVNRRLYLEPGHSADFRDGESPRKLDAFAALKNNLWGLMLAIGQETECRALAA